MVGGRHLVHAPLTHRGFIAGFVIEPPGSRRSVGVCRKSLTRIHSIRIGATKIPMVYTVVPLFFAACVNASARLATGSWNPLLPVG